MNISEQAILEYFAVKEVEDSECKKFILEKSEILADLLFANQSNDLFLQLKPILEKYWYDKFLLSIDSQYLDFVKVNIKLYNLVFREKVLEIKRQIDTINQKLNQEIKEKTKWITDFWKKNKIASDIISKQKWLISKIPWYLGSWSNGSAFLIEIDWKKYAVKFSSVNQMDFEIKPLIKAKGIKNVAQLVSYSFNDGVVIMDLLPWKDVSSFTIDDDIYFKDEHIEAVIQKVIELYNNWIIIDPKPSNFMYDKGIWFSILDFHLSNWQQSIWNMVMWLKVMLWMRKIPENISYETKEYNDYKLKFDKIYLSTMVRFLSILKQKFPHVLENWKKWYEQWEADSNISNVSLIDRSSYDTNNLEIEQYLKQLEKIGF